MFDEGNSYNLLTSLLQQEDHCWSKGNLKLKEIEEYLTECRHNVQKSTNLIKGTIHSVSNELEKLEVNLCLQLIEESQTQERKLLVAKDDLQLALCQFSKYINDVKVNFTELDGVDREKLSTKMVTKILPNIKELIKDIHVNTVMFIPMPLTVDNDARTISVGYVRKHNIDVTKFSLCATNGFHINSCASILVQSEMIFDYSKIEEYISWDVECEGKMVMADFTVHKNEFRILFNVEHKSQYRISFKLFNYHVSGSPLYIFPAQDIIEVASNQKRKSSSISTDPGRRLFQNNNKLAEDLTSLVDDLPLFAKEFGESCSVSLIQFFSKNLNPKSKPEQRNKKLTYEKLQSKNSEFLNINKSITDEYLHQPLRKPRATSHSIPKLSEPIYGMSEEPVEIKEEFDSFQKNDISNYENEFTQDLKIENTLTMEENTEMNEDDSIEKKYDPLETSTIKMIKTPNKDTSPKKTKSIQPLRNQWKEEVTSDVDSSVTEHNNSTQFNQFLRKRLAAKVAFCVQSSNEFGFRYPIGVAELESKQILVADTFNHRLIIFNAKGEFVDLVNTSGLRLTHPSAIAVMQNGCFAVRDDSTVHIFNQSCTYNNSLEKKHLGSHFGLAVDASGNLITVEISNGGITLVIIDSNTLNIERRINVFASDGIQKLKVSKPRFITFRHPHDLLIVDLGKDSIFIVDMRSGITKKQFGQSGKGNGQFHDPSGIVCDSEGYIIVGDSRNHRIQVFTPDGEFVTILRVERPLRRPSGLFLSPKGALFVLNYWEQSLVKFKLFVCDN